MEKLKNKTTKAGNDLLKLFMLLTVLSISYSTYVVAAGVEGIIPKILLIPQAAFAAMLLLNKFLK